MVESAALLVDDILPEVPIRQWVLSFPYALRFLFVTRPAVMGEVLGIVHRVIAGHLVKKAGSTARMPSSVAAGPEEFWTVFDRTAYEALKARYDPQGRLRDLYAKTVLKE